MKTVEHPSRAQLMAYLDGECDSGTHEYIRGHLQRCWKCRSDVASMEQAINGFVVALSKTTWPTDEHQDLSRDRLVEALAKTIALESGARSGVDGNERIPRIRWSRFAAVGAMAACVALLALHVGLFQMVDPWAVAPPMPLPHASRTMLSLQFAAWEQAELLNRGKTGAWRGTHEVSVRTPGEPDVVDNYVLESLNNGKTSDYHLRFRPTGGRVQHAAWQPGQDPRYVYVYRERRWGRLMQISRGVNHAYQNLADDVSTQSSGNIPEAVFRWVQAMVYDSHLPTRRFAQLAEMPGSRVVNDWHENVLWACVQVRLKGYLVTDCLVGDAGSGEVLRERLMFEIGNDPGVARSIEVIIDWAPAQPVAASLLYQSNFLPGGLRPLNLARARRRPAPPERLAAPPVISSQLLAAALDAEEAILALSSVEGPEFSIEPTLEATTVTLRGRVATKAQLESLQSVVLPLTAYSPMIHFDVKIAEDLTLPPLQENSPLALATTAKPLAADVLAISRPSMAAEDIRDLCNRIIQSSGNAVLAARRSAAIYDRYGASELASMSHADRRRLQDIRAQYQRQFQLAVAHLSQLFVQTGISTNEVAITGGAPSATDPALVYEMSKRLHASILGTFALGQESDVAAVDSILSIAAQVQSLVAVSSAEDSSSTAHNAGNH